MAWSSPWSGGSGGATAGGPVHVPFAHNSLSPLTVRAPGGKLLRRVEVHIETPWDAGSGGWITVGDAADPARHVAASAVDPETAAVYVQEVSYRYETDTDIEIHLAPGTSSQGAGTVLIYLES